MSLPSPGGLTVSPTGLVDLTVDPLADGYAVAVDGGEATTVTAFPYQIPGLVEGAIPAAHSVSVVALCDPSPPATASFTLPAAPPTGMDLYSYGPLPTAAQVAAYPKGICGPSVTTTWGKLQPSYKGPIDWSSLDAAVTVAGGRKLYLRVHAGDGCPKDLPKTISVPGSVFSSGPNPPPGNVTLPLWTDPTYLTAWHAFIAAMGARYDGRVTLVAMCGPSRQGEMVLPSWSGWVANGITSSVLLQLWKNDITAWRAAFQTTTTTLGMENTMGILGALLLWMKSTFGTASIHCQQNGLRATTPAPAPKSLWAQAQGLGFNVGAQTWGSVAQGSGPLSTELANAKVLGLSYVELYAADVATAANDSLFLQYGS